MRDTEAGFLRLKKTRVDSLLSCYCCCCYLLYQLGTGGCTQKAEPVRGVYP